MSRLSQRALNRATLARQMLLQREKVSVVRAVERLAGLQAQVPKPPYIGLWTRLAAFQRAELTRAVLKREIVRAPLMRCTLHLLSAKDYVALRASIQPALTAAMGSALRDRKEGYDLEKVSAAARAHLAKGPCTFEALREILAAKFPKADVRAMGYAVRTQLPVIQVPVESDWGYPAVADFAAAESWIDAPLGSDGTPHALILRYLAAFGPATHKDAESWSGLRGLKDAFAELAPKLVCFEDHRGRTLYDLPKAPRPDEDTDAPVRFLPEYDNLVLGHDDRSRLRADLVAAVQAMGWSASSDDVEQELHELFDEAEPATALGRETGTTTVIAEAPAMTPQDAGAGLYAEWPSEALYVSGEPTPPPARGRVTRLVLAAMACFAIGALGTTALSAILR